MFGFEFKKKRLLSRNVLAVKTKMFGQDITNKNKINLYNYTWAVVFVIIYMVVGLTTVQSVPITTKVVSSWRSVLDATLCDKVCQ